MKKKLNPQPLAITFALWSAVLMLLMSLAASLGFYTKAVNAMMTWHIFYSLSVVGVVAGMIEAAVLSALGVYLFVYIYNLVPKK